MLYVHTIIVLAVKSTYFKAMFYCSGVRESLSKEVVMKVHANESTYLTLIEAMYKPTILNNKYAHLVAQVLILLADKYYNVPKIFNKCQSVLLSLPLAVSVWETLTFCTTCLM